MAREDVERLASRSSRSSRGRRPAVPAAGQRYAARTYRRTTGAANRNESTRSRTPPWPGIRLPESFAPAARLSIDSARSPAWAASGDERPEDQRADRVLAEAGEHQGDDDRRGDDPADQPGVGLRRRDVGQELAAARTACRRSTRRCRTPRPRGRAAGSSPARALNHDRAEPARDRRGGRRRAGGRSRGATRRARRTTVANQVGRPSRGSSRVNAPTAASTTPTASRSARRSGRSAARPPQSRTSPTVKAIPSQARPGSRPRSRSRKTSRAASPAATDDHERRSTARRARRAMTSGGTRIAALIAR